jgi:hypothetical protein
LHSDQCLVFLVDINFVIYPIKPTIIFILTISGDFFDNDDEENDQEHVYGRAVARSENKGWLAVQGGDTVPPLVEKGLNDLPKPGGASAPQGPPHGWPCNYQNCETISKTKRGRESHISKKHVKPKTDCNVCGLPWGTNNIRKHEERCLLSISKIVWDKEEDDENEIDLEEIYNQFRAKLEENLRKKSTC